MPEIRGDQIQELGESVVAEKLARAEGISVNKAKDKLKKAREKVLKEKELSHGVTA